MKEISAFRTFPVSSAWPLRGESITLSWCSPIRRPTKRNGWVSVRVLEWLMDLTGFPDGVGCSGLASVRPSCCASCWLGEKLDLVWQKKKNHLCFLTRFWSASCPRYSYRCLQIICLMSVSLFLIIFFLIFNFFKAFSLVRTFFLPFLTRVTSWRWKLVESGGWRIMG